MEGLTAAELQLQQVREGPSWPDSRKVGAAVARRWHKVQLSGREHTCGQPPCLGHPSQFGGQPGGPRDVAAAGVTGTRCPWGHRCRRVTRGRRLALPAWRGFIPQPLSQHSDSLNLFYIRVLYLCAQLLCGAILGAPLRHGGCI